MVNQGIDLNVVGSWHLGSHRPNKISTSCNTFIDVCACDVDICLHLQHFQMVKKVHDS